MRHMLQTDMISIGEAAGRFGVSRRTVERWIRQGRLVAVPSGKDARRRLVDPQRVAALVRQMPTRSLPEAVSDMTETAVAEPSDDDGIQRARGFQAAIDDALMLSYSQIHRLVGQVCPEMFREYSIEELREGPLGRDLQRLALVALGKVREPKDLVLSAVDSVLQVFFWPVAADDYTVPRSFWDTEFGRMLAAAKFRAYSPRELISIGHAADLLGVTRPTLYRWMDDRTLNYVRDDQRGRTFLVRRDVENLKKVGIELAAQEAARAAAKEG